MPVKSLVVAPLGDQRKEKGPEPSTDSSIAPLGDPGQLAFVTAEMTLGNIITIIVPVAFVLPQPPTRGIV
jgi:hypothetical protein